MIDAYNYCQNNPFSCRHLLFISDKKVTYMGNLLLPYYQHILVPSEAPLSAPPADILLEELLSTPLSAPITPPSGISPIFPVNFPFRNHHNTISQFLKNIQYLSFHNKILHQFKILDQEHLPVKTPHVCHIHALLRFIQKNLPIHLTAYIRSA